MFEIFRKGVNRERLRARLDSKNSLVIKANRIVFEEAVKVLREEATKRSEGKSYNALLLKTSDVFRAYAGSFETANKKKKKKLLIEAHKSQL